MSDKHSVSGSSKGGGSVSGSAVASQSQATTAKGVAAIFQRGVMFPIFMQSEIRVDWKLTVLGLFVQAMQFIGLVFNPNYAWGPVFGEFVGKVVYFFNMPLFDTAWASNTFYAANAFYWIVVVLQLMLFVGVIVGLQSEHQQFGLASKAFAGIVTQSFSSFLLMPSVMILTSFMVCDTNRNHLFWWPEESCQSLFADVYFAIGVIALLLLCASNYLVLGTLYEDQPNTQSIMARAQSTVTTTTFTLKVAAGIMYHVLLSKGLHHVFATTLAAMCIVHALQFAFYLPFYRLWVNRFLCATFLAVATFAGVASSESPAKSTWNADSKSTVVVLCVGFAMWLLGWVLPLLRVSSSYRHAANELSQGRLIHIRNPTFPLGLPKNDSAFTQHRNVENVFVGQTTHLATEEMEEEIEESVTNLIPYLTRVVVSTDVEVSTRFINEHFDNAGSQPTDLMKAHGARIFIKGIARFRRNPLLALQFCAYLSVFGRKNRMAINEIENVGKFEPSFVLSYRAHRLQVKLKSSLNMSDTTHLKLLNSTLRLHKEILGHMSNFWLKLLSPNVDTVQLASIANVITSRREQAADMFRRVLLTPNQNILLKYARFLDQIMLDSSTSRVITDRVAEQAEARRQEMLAANQHGGAHREQRAESEIANEHADLMEKIDEATKQDAELSASSTQSASTIDRLSTTIHVLFSVLALLGVGFIIYESLRASSAKKTVQKIEAAGSCRFLSTMGGYFVTEIQQELTKSSPNLTQIGLWQQELGNISTDFFRYHSSITQGDLVTSFGPLVNFMKQRRTEIYQPAASGISLSGDFTRTVVDLFNLGFSIASRMSTIAVASDPTTISTSVMDFISLNARENFGVAYNRTIYFYEQENLQDMDTYFWVVTALFAAAALMIFVIYSTMVLNFQKIGASKLLTLSLFTLIPKIYLEQLHTGSKEKLETFDADDQKDQQDIDNDLQELTLGGGVVAPPGVAGVGGKKVRIAGGAVGAPSAAGTKQQTGLLQHRASLTVDQFKRDAPEEEEDSTKGESTEFSEVDEDEAKRAEDAKNAKKGMSATLRTFLYILQMIVLLGVVLALAVAAFVMVYRVQDLAVKNEHRRDAALANYDRQAHLYGAIIRLSDDARTYVESGRIEDLVRYREAWDEGNIEKCHRDIVYDSSYASYPSRLDTIAAMQTLVDDLVRRQHIAMWLASDGHGVSSDQQYLLDVIFASQRAYNFTSLQTTIGTLFSTFALSAPPSPATDEVLDAARNASSKLLTAKSLLFDDLYAAHFPLYERYRTSLSTSDLSDVIVAHDEMKTYFAGAIGLYCCCFAFFILLVRVYNSHKETSQLQRYSLVLGIIVVVANVVVLGVFLARSSRVVESFESNLFIKEARNESIASVRYSSSVSLEYAQFGDKKRYHSYVDTEELGTWENALSSLLRSLLRTVDIDAPETKELVQRIITLRSYGEALFSMDEASLLLTTNAFGYDLASSEFSFLADVVYSRSREPDYVEDVTRFGFSPLIYTNRTYDLAGLSEAQLSLSRATLSSDRYVYYRDNVLSRINDVFTDSESRVQDYLSDEEATSASLSLVTLALSVVILLIMVLTGMYAVFTSMNDLSSDAKNGGPTSAGPVEQEQLFEDLTHQSRVALIVLSLIVCANYGYAIYVTKQASASAHSLGLASTREWNIARSMTEVQRLFYDAQPSTSIVSPYTSDILRVIRELRDSRDAFYLGNSSSHPASFDAISSETMSLFGSDAYGALQFVSDCSSFRAKSSATAYDLNTSFPAEATIAAVFNDGVEPVVLQWMMILYSVASAPSVAVGFQFQKILNNLLVPLTSRLESASATYHTEATSNITSLGSGHFAIAAAFIFMIVVLLLLVFRPMIQLLLNEEQGTKLLLRMIPPTVRQNVPAIAEYLDTGSITQNEKMQKINEVVTEMSVVSLFVIDQVGTILRVSPAARDEFGYDNDDMVGKNIKMIMLDEVAIKHDDYLRRYRMTGDVHIIDRPTRVFGKRRDGSSFPIELLVKEFRKNANESTFLGFARNITSELEFEKVTKLNEAVSDMSSTPVIVIDAIGTVRRMNRAGLVAFGYAQQEIIGKNIKTLMPTRIAINHDGYLEAYQRTRKKTIIDSSRKVVGLRKNGEEFPVEVTVKEMVNDRGRTQFFIGYTKDITSDLLFTQSVMANEAVIQISPTPVISINTIGTVLIFSPAAELSWGYKAEEVLGKNIRMLMTEEDSIRHDGYLARYQKTGEKHIIDSVRVVSARAKDGHTFTVQANIKELRKGDHVTFIGYLKDMTRENQIAHRNRVNKTVFSASPVPIVVIDEMGMVQQFNPAAEKQLGYRADQVVNQNIKMLMPDVVAEHHDQYLLRYRETGIKSILDTKRRAHAKKADGRSIAVEILVKEVIVEDLLSDSGEKRLFVGYLRDITEEFQMMKANILNDAITNLCTIPMISINRHGSILTFSLAAEKQFGYKFEEVMGKNIKMLMPKSIADHHDGYLKRYAETGEKHVIDTTRLAIGLTASGQEFPAEIAVKEIRKSGLDTIFVGYVRNVKTEIEVDDTRLMVDTIVNVSPVPVIVINTKGIVQKFSTEAHRVFGWKPEEIVGKNIKMLMPQEIARNHDNYLKNYLKTGVKTIIDGIRTLQAVRKDGLQLSVEVMVRELKKDAENSESSLFVGYLRDMSQEYILRQSNELKDVILNESSIPMIQIDTKGRILFVNPALLAEFQYEEHELLNENVKILTPPEISRNHDSFLSTYLRTGVKHVLDSIREVTGFRKDGSRFPINISVRELESDGQHTYFGYIRNMAQSMQIRDQKALGDIIIDLSMIPLIIMDEIGTVMAFNRAASEAFRYEQEEVVGKNIKMLQTADVAAIHDQYLANYKKHRVKSVIDTTRRVMGRKKNGYPFPLEITVKELRDNDTMTSTYVGYLRNITDEYRLNLANEIADAVSAMSPTPLIAITTKGIITKFSRAAEEEFGWAADDVIGQNIKMLQPDDVASVHDGYLERYLKTGVKRVVDTTRIVTAKKRNGTEFPANITVREIQMDGVERTFVGFLRNLTQEIEDEASGRINFKIMGMMMTPLVVIDEAGTIEEANASLLETFGYEAEELLGSNVSRLMPEEIAEKHDGYLSRYLETGVKAVLKEKRIVTAKHHDGSRFPIEVNVKELFSKELNRRTYFGFLRDLRQDLDLKFAFMLNDAVTDMIATPIIAIDQVGTVLKFSKAASQVFGYDASEVVGRNVNTLMPEPFSSEHASYLSRYQTTRIKNVVDSERRVTPRRKDGSIFHASLRVREFSKVGGSSSFVGFLKDLTLMDAQEQETRISAVVSSMSQLAVIIADKRGFIHSVNDAASDLFRYRTEELVGQNLKMLMPRQYAMHHDNYLEAYHRTGVKHVIDTTRRVQGIKKGDVLFDIEIGVRALELDGIGTRYLGFVRDITNDVALEEASKVSNAIISLSPVPIIVIDAVGTIMQYSELAGALFGYACDEVVGRNVKLLMPEEIAVEHDGYLQRYIQTGVKHIIDNIRVAKARRKDGSLLEVEISVKNVKSTDGQLYFVGYVKPLGDIFSVYEAIKSGKKF